MTRRLSAAAIAAGLMLASCSSGSPQGTPSSAVPSGSPTGTTTAVGGSPTASGSPSVAPAPSRAQLARVKTKLTLWAKVKQPTVAIPGPDGATMFVGERGGRIRTVAADGTVGAVVLDLRAEVTTKGENGLLGMAFSPDGSRFYVTFTDAGDDVHLREYKVVSGAIDAASKRNLLEIGNPIWRHHGGDIVFGPDGHLWMTTGDGSEGKDPEDVAQSLRSLRGKILRLDPTPSRSRPYSVPRDNPFVDREGARPEIVAYGLRNPWRISFDEPTGDIWIADVGQYQQEEIDRVTLRTIRGANFGWNRLEGTNRFNGRPPRRRVDPIHEYNHYNPEPRCAVIGGHVYRGTSIPDLAGAYVFADFCDGKVRALTHRGGKSVTTRPIGAKAERPVAFARDAQGELYVLDINAGIFRLGPA